MAQSPRSERSPTPNSQTQAHEQATLEALEMAKADTYIYDLMRSFAKASRALAMYDCRACLEELSKLPEVHQKSCWVISMVGRAHYEMADYIKVTIQFCLVVNIF